jgi:hypothetical protein
MEHVPGFQVVIDDGPRRRRPKVRNPLMLTRLLLDVDAVKLKHGLKSDTDALRLLTKQEGGRWNKPGERVPTLTGWLHEARNLSLNPLLHFYEYARSAGDRELLQMLSELVDDRLRQFGE